MTKVIREVISQEPDRSSRRGARADHKSRGHFGRWLMSLAVVAGLGLFFLPTFAGWAVRSPDTLAWISGQPTGMIEIGQANFTWQGPVQLKNVVLHTPDGHALANVETLTSSQSLWGILTQQKQKIKLNLDGVRYTVTVPKPGPVEVTGRADLSQVTSTLQKFKMPAPSLPMEVTVTNCVIDFQNPQHEPIDRWSGISAHYQCDPGAKFVQTASATVPASSEHQTGELTLKGQWSRDSDSQQSETFSVETAADQVSLIAAAPWLEKYLGPEHGLTTCTGHIQATFQRDQNSGWTLTASGDLAGRSTLAGPAGQTASVPLSGNTTLELESQYDKEGDELTVSRLKLVADQAAVDLRGTVKQISGPQILHVLAEAKTPGTAILDLLPAELRNEIQIEGVKFSQIEVTGALRSTGEDAPAPLTYSLVASWDKALAYGLDSRDGQLRIRFNNGQVVAEPINVPVSGGKLLMLPTLDLSTTPATLRFQPGTLLQDVQLTEEVCRGWLMYISPTLAHATSANGRFTLAMNGGQLPLGEISKGDVGGVLVIRDGSVRPGPLAVSMLQQVTQVQTMLNRGGDDLTRKAFLTMKKEEIPFRLYQGRVYHENFGASVGEMRISTSGSMGLDHTLAMNLNIAFPEKWLAADRPVLQALAGAPIPLGITGTLEEPRIDGAGLAEFGKQLGVKAGMGLLEKLLERRQQKGR